MKAISTKLLASSVAPRWSVSRLTAAMGYVGLSLVIGSVIAPASTAQSIPTQGSNAQHSNVTQWSGPPPSLKVQIVVPRGPHPNMPHWYADQPQVQIVNSAPLVSNLIQPPPSVTYVLEVPQSTAAAQSAPVVVIHPTANQQIVNEPGRPNFTTYAPNAMSSNRSSLPSAGFINHVPVQQLPQTTERVSGRPLSAAARPAQANASNPLAGPVISYPNSGGASGSSSSKVAALVSGQIKTRGALLGH